MKTYRVGLVGTGVISAAHLRAWRQTDGCEVVGVFDLNQEMAAKRAAEFSIPAVYDDLAAMIASCDVIDVCTPPHTHAAIAREVLVAECRLVIEKPLVTDAADWEELRALADGDPGRITVIHNLKFVHSVRQAWQWVREGRIGRVMRIRREFLTSPATDRMLTGDNHWSHNLPGGRWFETLPHELYLTHWFVGALDLANVSVIHTETAPAGAPADEVLISLQGETCLATIHFSANCNQNRRVFAVQGSEGMISVDLLSDLATITTIHDSATNRALGRYLLEAGQTVIYGLPDRTRYAVQHLRGESPHTRIIQAFGRYLQGQGEPPTPLEEVDYVVRYCERIGREIDRQLVEMGVVHA